MTNEYKIEKQDRLQREQDAKTPSEMIDALLEVQEKTQEAVNAFITSARHLDRLQRENSELREALRAMLVSEQCAMDPLNPCWNNRPTDVAGKHWGIGEACVPCKARAVLAKYPEPQS